MAIILSTKKADGSVLNIPALVGPQGPQGPKGDDGKDGKNTVYVGHGIPENWKDYNVYIDPLGTPYGAINQVAITGDYNDLENLPDLSDFVDSSKYRLLEENLNLVSLDLIGRIDKLTEDNLNKFSFLEAKHDADFKFLKELIELDVVYSTATGRNIRVLDCTTHSLLELKIFGRCEQDEYLGTSLVDFDDVVVPVGTSLQLSEKTIASLGKLKFGSSYYFQAKYSGDASTEGVTQTLTLVIKSFDDTLHELNVPFNSKFSLSNYEQIVDAYIKMGLNNPASVRVFNMMISKGSKDVYEPFTNGVTAPSPSYPKRVNFLSEGKKIELAISSGTYTEVLTIPGTLGGIGEYRDTVTIKADGTGILERYIKKRKLHLDLTYSNGVDVDRWGDDVTGVPYAYSDIYDDMIPGATVMWDKASPAEFMEAHKTLCVTVTPDKRVEFRGVEGFSLDLRNYDIEVYYASSEPDVYPLDKEEVAKFLAFSSVKNLMTVTNTVDADMSVTYAVDKWLFFRSYLDSVAEESKQDLIKFAEDYKAQTEKEYEEAKEYIDNTLIQNISYIETLINSIEYELVKDKDIDTLFEGA